MAVNDIEGSHYRTGGVQTSHHRSFEKVVRSSLKYPHRPAVIVINQYWYFRGCNTTRGLGGTVEGAYLRSFLDNDYAEVARWYDATAISVRSAVLDLMLNGTDGFRVDRPIAIGHCYTQYLKLHNESNVDPSQSLHSFYEDDAPHPGCFTGGRVMGELAARVLLDAMESLSVRPLSDDERLEVDKLPLLTHDDLPPPVYDKNYDLPGSMCLLGKDIERLAVNSSGWNFTDESRGKWGFVATKVGDQLELKVPAVASHHSVRDPNKKTMVGIDIDFLSSYDKMGVAQVDCVSGCECDPMKIDAYHKSGTSESEAQTIAVSEHEQCIIRFTILNETRSKEKGHKFKIVGVTILPQLLEGAVGQRTYTRGDISTDDLVGK